MNSLPIEIQQKIESAIKSAKSSKNEDIEYEIANALKPPSPSPIDTRSADAFNQSMMDSGIAALHVNLIGLGDELGYFRALVKDESSRSFGMTSDDLAVVTGTDARYAKEWCITMAAGRVLTYKDGMYKVPDAIIDCVKIEQNPAGLVWGTVMPAGMDVRPKQVEAFKTGGGIDWNERDVRLFKGTCNFFKPLYENNLIDVLPPYIRKKLEGGCFLADIGCGQGLSTCILARAFPQSSFHGIDYSAASIQAAKERAEVFGVTTNVDFVVANSKDFDAPRQYDITCFFDCFHDMSVAKSAAKHAFDVTKKGGYCLLIEPMAAETDSVEDQIALPTAAMYGAFSCHLCLCCSKNNGGDGLGTICPTSTLRQIFAQAGYNSLRSLESPINDMGFRLLVAEKKL